jgi:hypothetical protein
MEPEQPAVTAAGYDQALARADADIGLLVQAYQATAAEAGEQQATVTVGQLIAGHMAANRRGLPPGETGHLSRTRVTFTEGRETHVPPTAFRHAS